jgi:DNA mismatch repair protein MutS2
MERALELPALVLLDEVGSGTDPIEGGALGTAVIDHFRQRGAVVVATTHDDALKSYAATTEGVATAAFGFEPDSYAPTYRLQYGAPGRSLAIEIAERLGLPASVIEAARARRSGRESLLAQHLERVDRELAVVDRERAQIARDRDAMAAERQRVLEREARLTEREAVLKKRFDDRLNEKIREARAEVDRIVQQVRLKADAMTARAAGRGPVTATGITTGDVGGLRADAREALEAVGTAVDGRAGAPTDEPLDAPPGVGDTVWLKTLATEVTVRSVSGSRVDVDVRGKRMRVGLADLARRAASPGSSRPSGSRSRPGSSGSTTAANDIAMAARELVVIGQTVDEAIARIEKFLDDALLADERVLRVVHGHGTGRLREAVRTFFKQHPLVARVEPAPDNQGGQGATIVELKDL